MTVLISSFRFSPRHQTPDPSLIIPLNTLKQYDSGKAAGGRPAQGACTEAKPDGPSSRSGKR